MPDGAVLAAAPGCCCGLDAAEHEARGIAAGHTDETSGPGYCSACPKHGTEEGA